MRVVLSILALFAALGLALGLHESLGRSTAGGEGAADSFEQDELRDDTSHRLVLNVGGAHPVLKLPESPTPQPSARTSEPTEPPRSAPPRARPRRDRRSPRPLDPPLAERFASKVLGQGETVYGLVVRHYGSARRLHEVLRFNGLSEAKARTLQSGSVIRLPE